MLLLSTDFQNFRAVGLRLRDNQFCLCLITLVAFEYYSSMYSSCIYVYVHMYTTSNNKVEMTRSINSMCIELDTQIGMYLYS